MSMYLSVNQPTCSTESHAHSYFHVYGGPHPCGPGELINVIMDLKYEITRCDSLPLTGDFFYPGAIR